MSALDVKVCSMRVGVAAGRGIRFGRLEEDEVWSSPYRNAKRVELVFCHFCGYGPPKEPPDGICPKCGKAGWEHSVVSERLLPAQSEE